MVSSLHVQRFAAFSAGDTGGNPAGVAVCDSLPAPELMQRVAAEIGYSETVFAMPEGAGWRVRYFAPAMEVPFCGHATVALGAALAARFGDGLFPLQLNHGQASVSGRAAGPLAEATLQSPPTTSAPAKPAYVQAALALFGWSVADLDPRLPPAIINAGANHLLLALGSREKLRALQYDQAAGKALMDEEALATILVVVSETAQLFHARNPFASGGVYEDPATGAAAAALGGYLRETGWPHAGHVTVLQGEDMGVPCRLEVEVTEGAGTGIRVSGTVRAL